MEKLMQADKSVLRAIEIGCSRDSSGAQQQLGAYPHAQAFVRWAVAKIRATHENLTQQEFLDKWNALPVEARHKITRRDVKLFFIKKRGVKLAMDRLNGLAREGGEGKVATADNLRNYFTGSEFSSDNMEPIRNFCNVRKKRQRKSRSSGIQSTLGKS
jgi:hypothetical protein